MAKEDVIALGDLVKDELTGFTGLAIGRTHWLSNCDRITIQPRELKDGQPQKSLSFDITHCELVESGVVKPANGQRDNREHIALGDTVRDTITGFEGIVIARSHWLTSCDNIYVQPKGLDKDGQPHDPNWFEANRVELSKKLDPPAPKERRGGPMPEPRRAQEPER